MKKKSKLFLAGMSLVFLTGCGYDGHFRYPCQDPANWESAECKPPVCTASGTCPEDLVRDETLIKDTQEGTQNG
jgi:predicted small lipoprotein YifL